MPLLRPLVLVHGAWYGGWCFRDVVKALNKRGAFDIFTPTLTGLGDRSHLLTPAVSLQTHVQDVVQTIQTQELENVVLLGHSYAGMVTTGVEHQLGASLDHHIYLDAYVPKSGQSAFGIRTSGDGNAVPLDFDSTGLTVPCPDPSHHGLSGPIADWARRQMSPMPKACWLTPLTPDTSEQGLVPGQLQRHYIRLRQFPAFYFDDYGHALAKDPSWRYQEYDLPHNHFMMEPDWLVDLLWPLLVKE
eukprot:m.23065 g.23065  ORF g.23065 m.23065 type:complete len:245 (+) comp11328_c0_seq1:104-838(+)